MKKFILSAAAAGLIAGTTAPVILEVASPSPAVVTVAASICHTMYRNGKC